MDYRVTGGPRVAGNRSLTGGPRDIVFQTIQLSYQVHFVTLFYCQCLWR